MSYAIIYLVLLALIWAFVYGANRKTPEQQIEDDNDQYEWIRMINRK